MVRNNTLEQYGRRRRRLGIANKEDAGGTEEGMKKGGWLGTEGMPKLWKFYPSRRQDRLLYSGVRVQILTTTGDLCYVAFPVKSREFNKDGDCISSELCYGIQSSSISSSFNNFENLVIFLPVIITITTLLVLLPLQSRVYCHTVTLLQKASAHLSTCRCVNLAGNRLFSYSTWFPSLSLYHSHDLRYLLSQNLHEHTITKNRCTFHANC